MDNILHAKCHAHVSKAAWPYRDHDYYSILSNDEMNFLSSDVPDPTDFSTSAPGLRNLDASLRCTICGDLFDAPVTLSCGHCFCSAVRVYSDFVFDKLKQSFCLFV